MTSQPLRLPPLYAIVDPEQTRGRTLDFVLRELLRGGVTILQLRAKLMSSRDFLNWAMRASEITRAAGCRMIINDRVDIALACRADGVHLGQEDLPLAPARRLMGEKIVGVSTHTIEQAREAERGGADYIGFGPLFGTTTKATGYPARGLESLAEVRRTVRIPIVAIGGITEENVTSVWTAGADSAAIISDILHSADIALKTQSFLARHTAFSQTSSG
jgi:thiamine-phosphate pyrophosphorylase